MSIGLTPSVRHVLRDAILTAAICALTPLITPTAQAQPYPNKPIRLVVPFRSSNRQFRRVGKVLYLPTRKITQHP